MWNHVYEDDCVWPDRTFSARSVGFVDGIVWRLP
jgi:hypothetical protein